MTNVNDLLRDHVTLTVECLDRLYLNGYIPTLQVPGQLVNFLIGHRGNTLPSPALLERITKDFADGHQMLCRARPDSDRAFCARPAQGRCGRRVSPAVRAPGGRGLHRHRPRESARVQSSQARTRRAHWLRLFAGTRCGSTITTSTCKTPSSVPPLSRSVAMRLTASRSISTATNGPSNRCARKAIAFEVLDNGFLSCANPERLQALCDQLGPPADPGVLR